MEVGDLAGYVQSVVIERQSCGSGSGITNCLSKVYGYDRKYLACQSSIVVDVCNCLLDS